MAQVTSPHGVAGLASAQQHAHGDLALAHHALAVFFAVAGVAAALGDDVDIIRKNCERLRTLVDQILNLKSAEEGEHAASCVPERVDVREVLRTVVAAVGDAVPRRGIAVHLGLPGEALTAEMCCDHFSKIVGQILGNAYQFAESRIDVTLEGPGGEVPGDVFRVRVRDDGAGIDRAEKARIFEPFYTSDKCVSGSGLGLGLAVAKSLATRMGEVLTEAGVPTTEAAMEAELKKEVVAAGSLITNDSDVSPFWRLVRGVVITPALWLIRTLLAGHVLPNTFAATATDAYLDLKAWDVDLTRKAASYALIDNVLIAATDRRKGYRRHLIRAARAASVA